jgi:hypothetical protein
MDVLFQLFERHPRIHRNAVAHDMEVVLAEVDHPASVWIHDVGVSYVPFVGNVQSKTSLPLGTS